MTVFSRIKSRLNGYKAIGEFVDSQDLRSMNAYGSSWTDSQFVNCQMNLANFQSSTLENVKITNCKALLGNWSLGRMKNVVFEECDIEQGQFLGTIFEDVTFKRCRLAYSTFEKGHGRALVFEECNLHGSDLRFHMAPDVEYRNSNLWGVYAQMGCQFFGSKFDERSLRMFAGMVSRVFPEGADKHRLTLVAGDTLRVVERLMKEEK